MIRMFVCLIYSLGVDTHIKQTASEFGITYGIAKNNYKNASAFYTEVSLHCLVNNIEIPAKFRALQWWKTDIWREWHWALDSDLHPELRMSYLRNLRIELGPAELANSYWGRRILPTISALSGP